MEITIPYDMYLKLIEKDKALEEIMRCKAVKIERNWGHFSYYVTNDKEMVEQLAQEVERLTKEKQEARQTRKRWWF